MSNIIETSAFFFLLVLALDLKKKINYTICSVSSILIPLFFPFFLNQQFSFLEMNFKRIPSQRVLRRMMYKQCNIRGLNGAMRREPAHETATGDRLATDHRPPLVLPLLHTPYSGRLTPSKEAEGGLLEVADAGSRARITTSPSIIALYYIGQSYSTI